MAVQPANSERALGMGVMENMLTSHPDLRAVFATNDQMALGAMEAIAARRLTGKIVLVGFDATREAVRAIEAGGMSAIMAQYPERDRQARHGGGHQGRPGQPVAARVAIDTTLVTKANAASFCGKALFLVAGDRPASRQGPAAAAAKKLAVAGFCRSPTYTVPLVSM